jgi:sarcosine oxidase subunit beta
METVDVGVIGAGVHGAAAAFHLSQRGVRVALIDPRGTAGGPTGRSSAICRAYYTNPFLAACARDSIGMLERFEELTGSDAGFRRTGMLYLHPPEDAAGVRIVAAGLRELGVPTEVLENDAVEAAAIGFDLEGIAIAAYDERAGYADPHAVTEGLVRASLARGARTWFGHRVERVRATTPAGAVLELDDHTSIACGRVLLAAGPWTAPLAAQVGAELPLTVERHVVATFAWADVPPAPPHADLVGGYYFRPEGEDLFLVGSLLPEPQVDPDSFVESILEDEIERLASLVAGRVPRLEGAHVHGGWASLYDVSPDWQPVIGQIAPGIFVDAGTSGHGFKLAPALGGHVAAMVLGEPAQDPGLSVFDPFRFAEGRRLDAGYGEARILG